MLQAMNTGHPGSLSTGHGNSPQDMLSRLEVMVLMGAELPLDAIRSQIASALDIMVHLGRLKDGRRKVLSIVEIGGYKNGKVEQKPLFVYDREEKRLKKTGELKAREKLADAGDEQKKVEQVFWQGKAERGFKRQGKTAGLQGISVIPKRMDAISDHGSRGSRTLCLYILSQCTCIFISSSSGFSVSGL